MVITSGMLKSYVDRTARSHVVILFLRTLLVEMLDLRAIEGSYIYGIFDLDCIIDITNILTQHDGSCIGAFSNDEFLKRTGN